MEVFWIFLKCDQFLVMLTWFTWLEFVHIFSASYAIVTLQVLVLMLCGGQRIEFKLEYNFYLVQKKKLKFSLLKNLTLCHILQTLTYWIAFFFSLCQATIINEYHMVPTLTVRATTLHLQLTYNYLSLLEQSFQGRYSMYHDCPCQREDQL